MSKSKVLAQAAKPSALIVTLGLVAALAAPVHAEVDEAGAVFRQTQSYRPADGPVQRAILAGSLYAVAVGDRALRGIDAATESTRWEVIPPSGRLQRAQPAMTLLVARAGDLLGVDTRTGAVQWTYPLNCPTALQCNQDVAAWSEDVAVVLGYDGAAKNVNLVDLKSGQLKWRTWASVPKVAHAIVVGNVIVVVGSAAPYPILGLDRATGKQLWNLGAGIGDKAIDGVSTDGALLAVWTHSPSGPEVVAIDAAAGQVRGRIALGRNRVESSPEFDIASGWAAMDGPHLLSYERKADGDTLSVRQLPSGQRLWDAKVTVASRPTVAGRLVLVHQRTPSGDVVEAFDIETGESRFAMSRKGQVRSIRAEKVGSLIQVGISGASPIVIGIRPSDGRLLTVALPKAPSNVSIDSIAGDDSTLVVVAGGTLYRMEAASVSTVGDELRQLLAAGSEAKAEELFSDVHDLVGALASAVPLTNLMMNHAFLVVESSMTAGDYAGGATRLREIATEDRLRYPADVVAFFRASSDLLTRKLHEAGPLIESRPGVLAEFVRAFNSGIERALAMQATWSADPGAAAKIEGDLMRLGFWLHLRGQNRMAMQLLGNLATADWAKRKDEVDTFRGAMLIGSAKSMVSNAQAEYKSKNYVESWAILRDVLQMPGMGRVIPSASEITTTLGGIDPEDRRGRRDLKKLLKRVASVLGSPAAPERGWTPATCVVDCQLASQTCSDRPCANWRHCPADEAACTQKCQLQGQPAWPQTQPATPGTPEWWNCR